MNQPVKVMKFGGTSVGAPERLRRVVEIATSAARSHRVVVIASAASGVTDGLVEAWDRFGTPEFSEAAFIESLRRRHVELAEGILAPASAGQYAQGLEEGLRRLEQLFGDIRAEGSTEALRDALLAVGERLSVPLVAAALSDAGLSSVAVDAADLIRTDASFGEAVVDLAETHRRTRRWYHQLPDDVVPVVTGFIGSTVEGETTTLGRGGSDYSAALLASALEAEVLERWTDVDGVYTEDPRTSKNAKRLAYIVLEEAWAWNQAGKMGMHRKALDPLVAAGIPVHVRCTATPQLPGTLIVPAGDDATRTAVAL